MERKFTTTMRTEKRLKPLKPLKKDPLIIRRRKRKLRRKLMKRNPLLERKKKNLKGDPDMMVVKLDPDILFEIFSLLPFKEAVQCRWVCKSWRTLLDDDFLINIHTKTQLKLLHGYDHHHAHSSFSSIVSFIYYSHEKKATLFGFYDDNLCSYKESSFNVSSSSSSKFLKDFNVSSSSSKFLKDTTMINSCNGLICLNKDYFYTESTVIYNPVTTEFLRLPWGGNYRIGGFGYHPSTKEYKILRTIHEYNDDDHHHQIYTLGTTGRWKDIEGSTSGRSFKYDVPGVHVNGALYWITENDDNKHGDNKEREMMIMSFDLADEEFRLLSILPPLLNNMKWKPHYKLVESQGCLFLFVDQYSSADDQHIELWVMKEKDIDHDNNNGFRYYWSNLMEISTVGHRNKNLMEISTVGHRNKEDYEFLALTHSGKVLFQHNGVLTCFDPKEERFALISDLPASSHRYGSGSAIIPHTNSLVSLIALGAIPKN